MWTFTHPAVPFLYSLINQAVMGSEFRFIHCADLHLGSRFRGLDVRDPAAAKRMRSSVFDSFSRIVDKAVSENVDALIISGDIYDDGNELPSTRMWFSQQLSRLECPVFICRGNHDSATSWDSSIAYPDNVHEFSAEPERIDIGKGVEIVGVSYREQNETRNLAKLLSGDPERFTIGCMHCDVDGDDLIHPYAPCSSADLRGRGVDYWALGHIHKRQVISNQPYAVYPGNIQGRSPKETGHKGAYLVTVRDSMVSELEFFRTSSYHWEEIEVDITGKDLNGIVNELRLKLDESTIARITFKGSGSLDRMLRTQTEDVVKTIASATRSEISSVTLSTSPEVDLDSRADGKDIAGALIRSGRRVSSLSRDEILDIICANKVAAKYRDLYDTLSDDDLRKVVDDAMRKAVILTEAGS